ncbi:MAG: hypothetical protein H7Y42_12385, partial [Chitinophagaceae bacterium]|nr:hypothetical protein [Chitinophagaceae bacterium]
PCMPAPSLRRKEYAILGRYIYNQYPELAQEILQKESSPSPKESDFRKIEGYFISFCGFMKLDPAEFRGQSFNRDKTETRRVFIAAIIHLYAPNAYNHPVDILLIKQGLITELARVLLVNPVTMQGVVRQSIFAVKTYDDFKERVILATNHLNS